MDTTIFEINIENIRGIKKKSFIDLNLVPNKPTIFVAPNGFGKSSFATAFKYLDKKKINLEKDDYFKKNENNKPTIEIVFEGDNHTQKKIVANEHKNDIAKEFNIFVINNSLVPKASIKKFGNFSFSKPRLAVSDIVLQKKIPEKISLSYQHQAFQKKFGLNGKILENINNEILGNLKFIVSFCDKFSEIKKINKNSRIADFIENVNKLKGNVSEIKKQVDIYPIEKIKPLNSMRDIFQKYFSNYQLLDCYLIIIQLSIFFKDKEIYQIKKYFNYKIFKKEAIEMLSCLCPTWNKIEIKESKGSLILSFPSDIRDISNGERDSYLFLGSLIKIKEKLSNKKNTVLVIDEVFDYLDDSNLLIVQYYITKFISSFRKSEKNIFPIILTHLNPYLFKNYLFSDLKIHFLKKSNTIFNKDLSKIICKRRDVSIKDNLDKHFLHFSENKNISLEEEFEKLSFKKELGNINSFRENVESEFLKYKNNKKGYDPVSVCLFLRINIEKFICSNMSSIDKDDFIETKGTKEKLDFARRKNVEVQEIFYLLGAIYNDLLHIRDNQDWVSPIKSKLENKEIKNMVLEAYKIFNSNLL